MMDSEGTLTEHETLCTEYEKVLKLQFFLSMQNRSPVSLELFAGFPEASQASTQMKKLLRKL